MRGQESNIPPYDRTPPAPTPPSNRDTALNLLGLRNLVCRAALIHADGTGVPMPKFSLSLYRDASLRLPDEDGMELPNLPT